MLIGTLKQHGTHWFHRYLRFHTGTVLERVDFTAPCPSKVCRPFCMATREPLPGYWKLARKLAPASRTTSEFTLPYLCLFVKENRRRKCPKTLSFRANRAEANAPKRESRNPENVSSAMPLQGVLCYIFPPCAMAITTSFGFMSSPAAPGTVHPKNALNQHGAGIIFGMLRLLLARYTRSEFTPIEQTYKLTTASMMWAAKKLGVETRHCRV